MKPIDQPQRVKPSTAMTVNSDCSIVQAIRYQNFRGVAEKKQNADLVQFQNTSIACQAEFAPLQNNIIRLEPLYINICETNDGELPAQSSVNEPKTVLLKADFS